MNRKGLEEGMVAIEMTPVATSSSTLPQHAPAAETTRQRVGSEAPSAADTAGAPGSVDSESIYEKTPKFLVFLHWFKNWPKGARAVIYCVLGSSFLMIPGIVDVLLTLYADGHSDKPIDLHSETHSHVGSASLFSWSVYFSLLWSILIMSDLAITAMPSIISVLVKALFGRFYVEIIRPRLEVLSRISNYIAAFVTSLVAIAVRKLFLKSDKEDDPLFTKILSCVFVVCTVVAVEKLLLNMIRVHFHNTAYAKRLKENNFFSQVLERLLEARESIKGQGESGSLGHWWPLSNSKKNMAEAGPLASLDSQPGSPVSERMAVTTAEDDTPSVRSAKKTGLSILQNSVKTSFKVVNTGLDYSGVNMVKDVVGDVTKAAFTSMLNGGVAATHVKSSEHGRIMAGKIFRALSQSYGKKHLTVEGFYPYFERKKFAEQAFALFDKDNNGDLEQEEFTAAILNYYHDSKSIESGIKDLARTVGKLDGAMMILALCAIIVICCTVFGVDLQSYLLSVGSLLLALSFVIGDSLKKMFTSCLFVFIYHPFDVGDRVAISGLEYVVSQMDLTLTIFIRGDGQEVYIANHILSEMIISNYRRSPNQSEPVKVSLAIDTDESKLNSLESTMTAFVKENPRDFLPTVAFSTSIEEVRSDKLEMATRSKLVASFSICYKGNWQEASVRSARRNKFMTALRQALVAQGIYSSDNVVETKK